MSQEDHIERVLITLLNNNVSCIKDDMQERLHALIHTAFEIGVQHGRKEAEALHDALQRCRQLGCG